MSQRTIFYNIAVLLLVASYATTDTVLPVVHFHGVCLPGSASFQAQHKSETSGNCDPTFCSICFRINTTYPLLGEDSPLPAVLHILRYVPKYADSGVTPVEQSIRQVRAPPLPVV